jgi:hypothetical protein
VRATRLVIVVVLTAALVAGCGSSGGQTASLNGETVTVPSDVHGFYGELEALLAQFPYQAWYSRCVVTQVKKDLSPAEAEAFAKLPESTRQSKATQIIGKAGPACEKSTGRPVIDPNAPEKEIALYRAGYIAPMRELAEKNGMSSEQVSCVEEGFEELPDAKVVELGNGSHKAREGILLSVFEPCAKVK